MIKAAVSGSFHRHLGEIQGAVFALRENGVAVLSPADPRVVDEFGEFLFVASDRLRVIRAVQSRHLRAIQAADFLWLVAPDGYVGQSASMEIGFAVAVGTPVLSVDAPNDLTLRQYVTIVPTLERAVERCSAAATPPRAHSVLLEPVETAKRLHDTLEQIERRLTSAPSTVGDKELRATFASAQDLLKLP